MTCFESRYNKPSDGWLAVEMFFTQTSVHLWLSDKQIAYRVTLDYRAELLRAL